MAACLLPSITSDSRCRKLSCNLVSSHSGYWGAWEIFYHGEYTAAVLLYLLVVYEALQHCCCFYFRHSCHSPSCLYVSQCVWKALSLSILMRSIQHKHIQDTFWSRCPPSRLLNQTSVYSEGLDFHFKAAMFDRVFVSLYSCFVSLCGHFALLCGCFMSLCGCFAPLWTCVVSPCVHFVSLCSRFVSLWRFCIFLWRFCVPLWIFCVCVEVLCLFVEVLHSCLASSSAYFACLCICFVSVCICFLYIYIIMVT